MKRPILKDPKVIDYVLMLEDQVYSLERQLQATEEYKPIEERITKILEDLGFKRG